MLSWFRRNPIKKLEAEYAKKLEQARDVQRNGDIVGYSSIMAEANEILSQIQELECGCDRAAEPAASGSQQSQVV